MRYKVFLFCVFSECGLIGTDCFRDSAQVPRLANASLRLSARELRLARDIDRYFRQELIHKRNHRMGDRVLRLLRAHPGQSFFFAFGAGNDKAFLPHFSVS